MRKLKFPALEVLDLKGGTLRKCDLKSATRYFALLIGLTDHSVLALTESYTENQSFSSISDRRGPNVQVVHTRHVTTRCEVTVLFHEFLKLWPGKSS
jgi:hypothetical protein